MTPKRLILTMSSGKLPDLREQRMTKQTYAERANVRFDFELNSKDEAIDAVVTANGEMSKIRKVV